MKDQPFIVRQRANIHSSAPFNQNEDAVEKTKKAGKFIASDEGQLLFGGDEPNQHFIIDNLDLKPEQFHYGIGRERFPALIQPRFESVGEASSRWKSSDRFLLAKKDGEVKAYSVKDLTRHEVVNDSIGGEPIFAAYCILADLGAEVIKIEPHRGESLVIRLGVVEVLLVLVVGRLPRAVGNRPLGHDADVVGGGDRQHVIDVPLVAHADRRLEDGDVRLRGRPRGGLVVTGVAGETDLPRVAGFDDHAEDIAALKRLEVARVQQHDVEAVGAEALQ